MTAIHFWTSQGSAQAIKCAEKMISRALPAALDRTTEATVTT